MIPQTFYRFPTWSHVCWFTGLDDQYQLVVEAMKAKHSSHQYMENPRGDNLLTPLFQITRWFNMSNPLSSSLSKSLSIWLCMGWSNVLRRTTNLLNLWRALIFPSSIDRAELIPHKCSLSKFTAGTLLGISS